MLETADPILKNVSLIESYIISECYAIIYFDKTCLEPEIKILIKTLIEIGKNYTTR